MVERIPASDAMVLWKEARPDRDVVDILVMSREEYLSKWRGGLKHLPMSYIPSKGSWSNTGGPAGLCGVLIKNTRLSSGICHIIGEFAKIKECQWARDMAAEIAICSAAGDSPGNIDKRRLQTHDPPNPEC